jgi:hypothetical protein
MLKSDMHIAQPAIATMINFSEEKRDKRGPESNPELIEYQIPPQAK